MLRAALLLVLVLPLAGAPLRADPPTQDAVVLSAEERAFCDWWDRIGYPDVITLPFVKVWDGNSMGYEEFGPIAPVVGAFLISEQGATFTVFTTDLRTRTYTATSPDARAWDRVGFERADLAAFAEAGLAGIHASWDAWSSRPDGFHAHRWDSPNQAFRIAVLARALVGRGRDDLARKMFDRARLEEMEREGRRYGAAADTSAADFAHLRKSLTAEAEEALDEAHGDEHRSWEDLLADTERWARAFSPEAFAEPDGRVPVLRRLVADRQERAARPALPPEPQSPAERAKSLVHDLPEASGHYYDEGFEFRYVEGGPEAEERLRDRGPVPRLLELGFDAVPALIAALDDTRPTRMVKHHDTGHLQWRGPVAVPSVGQVAWHILNQLSGGSLALLLAGGPPTSGQPSQRQLAQEWYADAQERGQTAILTEEVVARRTNALQAARRLSKVDPDAAVPLFEGQTEAGDERYSQHSLLGLLTRIPGAAATAALQKLLVRLSASDAGTAVAAELWQRGYREGLDELIRRWQQAARMDRDAEQQPEAGGLRISWYRVIQALVVARHVDAIRALADGLDERAVDLRLRVVVELSHRAPRAGSKRADPNPPVVEEAIEALLAQLLEDADRAEDVYTAEGPLGVEPVVGQVAALTLAERYPERWTFDAKAKHADREVARRAHATRWRASRGLPPLPASKSARAAPPPIPLADLSADVEAVLDLGAALQGASARTDGASALRALEARGLAAVPALREVLATRAKGLFGTERLKAPTSRLSFQISEVAVADGSRPLPPALAELLASAKGLTFDAALFYEAWRLYAAHDPEPGTRLTVHADREPAEAGVRLTLALTAPTARPQPEPGMRCAHPWVRRSNGRKRLEAGALPQSIAATPGGWDDWVRRFQRLLDAAELDDPFEAEGSIERQR